MLGRGWEFPLCGEEEAVWFCPFCKQAFAGRDRTPEGGRAAALQAEVARLEEGQLEGPVPEGGAGGSAG